MGKNSKHFDNDDDEIGDLVLYSSHCLNAEYPPSGDWSLHLSPYIPCQKQKY